MKSTRGQSGGYCLNVDPDTTLVVNVLECLGGRLYGAGFCDRHRGILADCVHDGECRIRPLWIRLQVAVDSALEGVTIGDIIEGRLESPPVVFYYNPEQNSAMSHR